jgi:two-component system sensor histidine kinase VicK
MTKAAELMAEGDFSRKIAVESGDEIGVLSGTFNTMAFQLEGTLEELKKAEKLRRDFVANVSHELRTPLTSIRTYAETLTENDDLPFDMQLEFLRVILNESDRMTKIVQDLLELSKFDSGNTKFNIERFSLESSVRDVYAAMVLTAQQRGLSVNLDLPDDLPQITGDRARVEQVLMNVITNAVKYTPEGGVIDITAAVNGGTAEVKISDTGVGIPEEDMPHVFDRFYRVDKARSRESGGTGLGLSIAREIIVRHGGDISMRSVPGEGTQVTITLPVEGVPNEA